MLLHYIGKLKSSNLLQITKKNNLKIKIGLVHLTKSNVSCHIDEWILVLSL